MMSRPEPDMPANRILDRFTMKQVLDEDPKAKTANVLGSYTSVAEDGSTKIDQAILIIEKTHLDDKLFSGLLVPQDVLSVARVPSGKLTDDHITVSPAQETLFTDVAQLGQNDIYTWITARFGNLHHGPDLKMTLIHPATQIHIDKYSAQRKVMVTETPAIYRDKVLPWIESFPPSRIQWVYNILEHKKEAETIMFEDPDPEKGFIIVPDLKWDQKTTSSLYIQAIVHNRKLRSIRDLTKMDVQMLENIKAQASKAAFDKYGLTGRDTESADGNVRCFLHYQPSYYHLHVHILAASFTSHPGAIVGQAHLLDDVIDLLKLGVDMKQRTFYYALGTNSKLWSVLFPSEQ